MMPIPTSVSVCVYTTDKKINQQENYLLTVVYEFSPLFDIVCLRMSFFTLYSIMCFTPQEKIKMNCPRSRFDWSLNNCAY